MGSSLEGQAGAFGWIVDGAAVADDLEAQAVSATRTKVQQLEAALRAEGARMVVNAMEKALRAGLRPTS